MNILLNDAVAATGEPFLREHFGDAAEVVLTGPDDEAASRQAKLERAEIFVTTVFESAFLPMPALRLVHIPASGFDGIDFEAVPAKIPVCNAFEHDIGIADHVMAAVLQFAIDLPGRDQRFRSGDWTGSANKGGPGRPELGDQTLVTIGYGSIGRAVAKRAQAFGIKVVAVTRTPRALDPAPAAIVGFDRLHEALGRADYVLVACPLSEQTRGLIDSHAFAAMKPDAVLINVARGPIVDEQALFEALQARRIKGAAIDVWYRYPSPDEPHPRPSSFPFHELDNVIMTPHSSGWTADLMRRRFAVIIENIERQRAGRPLRNQLWPKGAG